VHLVEAWYRAGRGPGIPFVVDGWSLPGQVYELFRDGRQHDVPVIIGYTADEASALGGLAGRDRDGHPDSELRSRISSSPR
jgi:carboxylesterase type B